MHYLFELGVNLFETLLITWFMVSYLGVKDGKRPILRYVLSFAAIWASEFAIITVINSITFFESYATLICALWRFAFALIFLKGNPLLKLWISSICQVVLVLCALVGNLLICFIMDYSPVDMIMVFNWQRVVGVLFTKVVLFVAYIVILKLRTKNPIKTRLWYMLIIVPIMSVYGVCRLMEIALQYEDTLWQVLSGMLCIVAANLFTYYFYTVISNEYGNRMRLALLEQEKENAEKHVEQGKTFVEQMRKVRHDIRNHLTVVSLHLENGRVEEAKGYLKEISDNHIPQFRGLVSSGNNVLDAVINSVVFTCNSNGIFFQVKLSPDMKLPFTDSETAVVIGNLLDNAVEAALRSKAKRITLEIDQKGDSCSILMSNSIDASVLEANPDLATSKEDKDAHGIGIKSVSGMIRKYDGIMEFFEENGEFCCHIII